MTISELINQLLVIRQDVGNIECRVVDPFALANDEFQYIEPALAENQDGAGYPSVLVLCDSDTAKRLTRVFV